MLKRLFSPKTELAQKTQTRIVFDSVGTPGLQDYGSGFISKAYNQELTWPSCYSLFNRLRRADPEIAQVRLPFASWARGCDIKVKLPDDATEGEQEAGEFYESVLKDMEGGSGKFKDTLVQQVPFMGWGSWDVQPGRRDPAWTPPEQDEWRSEQTDGRVGIRRLDFRDQSTFQNWIYKNGRPNGWMQNDPPNTPEPLPFDHLLHITFGDANNPEGLSPLEAVWRVERIQYGYQVTHSIGAEHSAGYVEFQKTEAGALSAEDKANLKNMAKAILQAQQGNYAYSPYGLTTSIKDIAFTAAPALLEAIKYYGVVKLTIFAMQWIALSATTGAGSFAAMDDSSSVAVATFNAMMDGFISQFDQQVGRRLWEWNKSSFPAGTRRPEYTVSHIEKKMALAELGAFLSAINTIVPLGDSDMTEIRKRSGFLPEELPVEEEVENIPEEPVPGETPVDAEGEPIPVPPEQPEEETPEMIVTTARLIAEMQEEVNRIEKVSK